MAPPLWLEPLLLIALVFICLLLHGGRPARAPAAMRLLPARRRRHPWHDLARQAHLGGTYRARSPHWGGTARAPESKLLLSVQAGPRPLARAQAMRQQSPQLLAPGGGPRLVSDGHPNSLPTMVAHCGRGGPPRWCQDKGPALMPRGRPLPELRDVPVVTTRRRRRRVEGKPRGGCGTKAEAEQVWAVCAWQSNPALVERLPLRWPQRGAARGRRDAPIMSGAGETCCWCACRRGRRRRRSQQECQLLSWRCMAEGSSDAGQAGRRRS